MKTPKARLGRSVSTGWLFAVSFVTAFSLLPTMVAGQRLSVVSARQNSLSHQGKPTRLKRGRSTSLVEGAARPRIVQASRGLPLAFEPNVGQTDPQVKFLSRGNHYALFLTGTEAVLTLRAGSGRAPQAAAKQHRRTNPRRPDLTTPTVDVVRMQLERANFRAQIVGLDPLPGSSNYFRGKDPEKWRRNVPNYAKVKYQDIYPGVDLVYYGNQRQLEYDFVVRPGADPKTIALTFNGSTKSSALTIDPAGDLVIPTSGGEFRFHKPVIYQPQETPAGARQSIEGRFVMLAENQVGFEVAAYDRLKPLVIDPTMIYATFLGGSQNDAAADVAADGSGNAYVTGYTASTDFPTTNSGTNNGNFDAFVTKLNATGSSRVYSTYLGGSDSDFANGIAVDANGNAFVTGSTTSTDFPATVGDTKCGTDLGGTCNGGSSDAFVAKLNSSGVLAYATYLGGSGEESGFRIRVDSSGNTYLTGRTTSADFPVPKGFQTVCSSCTTTTEADAFVAKLNATGSSVLYSTFLGGDSLDVGNDLALDGSGNIWVIGQTDSTDFPTTSDALQPTDPDSGTFRDAFLAKVNPAASSGATSLVYSSYIGGDGDDEGFGIALDASGNIYIAGDSFSSEAPAIGSGFDSTPNGDDDAVVAKLDPTATQVLYFTFLGGASFDFANAIAVDSGGNAYVTGATGSTNFPTASPLQATNQGNQDAFLAKLSADGKSLVYSSYLGGTSSDDGFGLALDSSRNAYIAGSTESTDFPATPGSVQDSIGGFQDGFVAKVALAGPDLGLNPSSLFFGSHLVGSTTTKTLTVTNTGTAALHISAMTIGGTNAGDFTLDSSSTCSTSASAPVVSNGSCTAAVKFKPGAVGLRSAALAIASNAGNGSVPLSGVGASLSFAAASGSQLTATVAAGGTATYNLTIKGPILDVALSCTGVPQASTCTVTPGIVHLLRGEFGAPLPTPFTVTVATTARSLILPQSPEGPNVPGWKLPQLVPLQLMWLLALLALAGIATRRRRARYVLATALLCVLMWGACGGDNTPSTPRGTPAGTYNLTISGVADGVTKTVGLVLNVN